MHRKITDLRQYMLERLQRMPNGCLEYSGGRDKNGYGRVKVAGRDQLAHRVWFSLENNIPLAEVPPLLMHSCDNPPCCDMDHVSAGTYKMNAIDAHSKGRGFSAFRGLRSEDNTNAKLTQRDVDEIRELFLRGWNNHEIADRFIVHHSTISQIRVGKAWKTESLEA